ncbi:hypothetical protein [Archangium sp.]|uniref:hypothetical protein n=1 Tax=Archangium sp. TaxID=1872627 RepID=UPI002D315BF5|nr:hypothetical protein [Archangium sp.]HYO51261.1 hypothetical protein [Archangium sp.]
MNAGPVEVKTAPVFNPAVCSKKRVDACGCHHVYGVRHCHPKRKSDHCEAMVQAAEPTGQNASHVQELFSFEPDPATEHEEQDSATL